MEHLFENLQKNGQSDIYPCHMPGHKRRSWGALPEELYKLDITEIDGFDNLHQPEGLLLELQKKAAQLYGAEESFYLVNGSTCGILSAVSSVLPPGGHILMARNCHKSVYHGAYLRNLTISYLYPPYLAEYDIFDAITPLQVQAALEREPDIGAVLIVSPTYEGRIADVGRIAEIVHAKGIPLIVDEAHGAHLGLAEGFPGNSCQAGADLVIHSVHKTLPALTQTALLHVSGALVNRELLKRFLHIYQSSSPSYLLMASIDNALQYAESNGTEAFWQFKAFFQGMLEKLSVCRHLKILSDDRAKQDVGKLLISVKNANLTGKQLYDTLLEEYHLQCEMAAESFVLAMFTVNDGEDAYRRMTRALLEIDDRLAQECVVESRDPELWKTEDWNPELWKTEDWNPELWKTKDWNPELWKTKDWNPELWKTEDWNPELWKTKNRNPELWKTEDREAEEQQYDRIPFHKAWNMPTESAPLEDSIGLYAGEFVNLYPPGIPLLIPGEQITEELCRKIWDYINHGLTVQGVKIQEVKIQGVKIQEAGVQEACIQGVKIQEGENPLGKRVFIKVLAHCPVDN